MTRIRVATPFAIVIGAWPLLAVALNGDLDPAFGAGGLALTGVLDAYGNGARGPVIDADGHILVCDTRGDNGSSGSDFFVARFLADGTLDPSFSFDGRVTIDFDGGTGQDLCNAIALQDDGAVVVAGSTRNASGDTDMAVARLTPDGELDTNFGGGTGKVTIPFDLVANGADAAASVAIQANGRIVVAGSAATAQEGNDFAVARLLADGTLDAAFNLSGKVTIGFDLPASSNHNDAATVVRIDAGQRIVLAGNAENSASGTSDDFAIARLMPNGQLDPNFDADGRATLAFDVGASANDMLYAFVIDANGRLVLAGAADTGPTPGTTNFNIAAARLLPDGTPDASFGLGGRTLIAFDLTAHGTDGAFGLAEQPNGKLVLVGLAQYDTIGHVLAISARLTRNGSLDEGYGTLGKHTYDLGLATPGSQVMSGVAIAGNRIVVTGGALVSSNAAIDDFVARLADDLLFADGFD